MSGLIIRRTDPAFRQRLATLADDMEARQRRERDIRYARDRAAERRRNGDRGHRFV